jgi:hypothetical protein
MEALVLVRRWIFGRAISVALLLALCASARIVAQSSSTSHNPNFSGGSGIALIQDASEDAGIASSAALSFNSNNTAGNWIGVAIRAGAQGETFAITDSNGNTYHQAVQTSQTGDGDTVAIYYAENIAGGPNTVTVTDSISNTLRFAILEYSGVATSGSLDVAAAAQGQSGSPDSGSVTTTANGDLLLGTIMTGEPETFSAGSGYKIEESVPAEPYSKLIAEDQIQEAAGGSSASALIGANDNWAALLAAFKPAASGGETTAPNITNIAPTSGPVGTQVTITGMNFGSTMGTVTFNGVAATPTSWSATSLVVVVPAGATTGNVVVGAGGIASNGVSFNITSGISAGAGIALMQDASEDAGVATSGTLGFNSNNAAGNFIAVVIRGGAAGESFAVSDSNGNIFNLAVMQNQTADGDTLAIYYAMNIGSGANSVTVTQTAFTTLRFAILEYSGVATTSALDVATSAQGSGTSASSGSVTTIANGDLLLGGMMTSTTGVTYTAGTGYTSEEIVPATPRTKLAVEDQMQASAGSTSATATFSTSQDWAAGLAAFRAARKSSSGSSGGDGLGSDSQGLLSASTLTLNLGNVNIGSSLSQTISLSNSGNGNVTISNVSTSGAGIAASGVYVGLVLTPGQTAVLTVTLTPVLAGSASGAVTITSNALNSPISIAVSGTGVQPGSVSVGLAWEASTGAAGYNVYRGLISGGPYAILTASPVTTTSFIDTTVQPGQTYYYVVTSLSSTGTESAYSNQASVTIP